jgi:hypothetical protein
MCLCSQVGFWRSDAYDHPSRQTDPANSKQYVVLSMDFAAAKDLARTVLPCLDDPATKAVFKVSVEAPADRTVLSNSPAVSSVPSTLPGGQGKLTCTIT